jgi:hypothetical protein
VDEILGYARDFPAVEPAVASALTIRMHKLDFPANRHDGKAATTARLYSQSPHDGTPPTGPGGVSVGSAGVCGTVAGRGAGNPALWDSP